MLLTFGGKALGRFWEDLHLMQNRSLAAVGWEQNYPGLWEKLTNLASQKCLSRAFFVWKDAAVPCK